MKNQIKYDGEFYLAKNLRLHGWKLEPMTGIWIAFGSKCYFCGSGIRDYASMAKNIELLIPEKIINKDNILIYCPQYQNRQIGFAGGFSLRGPGIPYSLTVMRPPSIHEKNRLQQELDILIRKTKMKITLIDKL